MSWLRNCLAAMAIAAAYLSAGNAAAAVLFLEDFSDATLEAGTVLRQGAVAAGQADFNDVSATEKASVSVVQNFTSSVMTFSFDVVAAATGATNEIVIRAADGTGNDMPGSGDDVAEHILHRDNGNRETYLNNGDESIFMVVNNQAPVLNFTSPVDGSAVALSGNSYLVFIRDNIGGVFTQPRAERANDMTQLPITRFAIGHTSNSRLGPFSLDNVRVDDEVFFGGAIVPEPASIAMLMAGCGLILCWPRRTA